ncbi:MAG: ABC transporter substrate-binding protein [Deltaproteobacteria bacterium]|nr:ABC transporter substrate-binding protein [Deltaproteobacteria bacterium]
MASLNPVCRIRYGQWLSVLLGSMFAVVSSECLAASEVGGKPEKSDVVVVYTQPSGGFTPVWVAYEAGLFKKYGLNVKFQVLNPQVAAQAVVAGEVDFSTAGSELISARLKGARVKYFGGTLQQLIFQMWGVKEITSIQQLRGKTVAATTPRAAVDAATRETLKKNGIIPDKEVSILYVQTVPAVLISIITGKTAAGTLSAPNTLKAREAGLNLLADIGRLNIPGIQVTYSATESYLKRNPNTTYAFLKAIAEGVLLAKTDPSVAKKAIAKYAKIDDPKMLDGTYDAFAPYWDNSLAVRPEVIRAQFDYLDEKEFPAARNTDPREFFDNSFVENLEKAGFFKGLGLRR